MPITKGPLTGIRVLDLTQAHAGPFGTMLLGDLGAEVIKLEPPPGELLRLGDPKVAIYSYYFTGLNRNKKGMVLDLKHDLGKQAFLDLVKKSDIVYSNYRAGVPERLGIDFDSLSKINPGIICCNITGYGDTGPYAEYPAFDIIACGHSGILSLSGDPETGKKLIPGGIAMADMMGGIFGTMSVLSALLKRNRNGKGMKVSVNLLDSLLVMQQVMFQNYYLANNKPGLQGRRHLLTAGYGIYDTKDGLITFASVRHAKAMRALGLGHLLEDDKFKTRTDRIINRDELDKYLEDIFLTKTSNEWIKYLRDENDIPCGPVLNYEDIMRDPQIAHNKMIIEMELRGEKYKTIGSIFKLRDTESKICGEPDPPPDLGQHTVEILKNILHYPDDKIKQLLKENNDSIPELKKRLMNMDIGDQIDDLKDTVIEGVEAKKKL